MHRHDRPGTVFCLNSRLTRLPEKWVPVPGGRDLPLRQDSVAALGGRGWSLLPSLSATLTRNCPLFWERLYCVQIARPPSPAVAEFLPLDTTPKTDCGRQSPGLYSGPVGIAWHAAQKISVREPSRWNGPPRSTNQSICIAKSAPTRTLNCSR